DECRGVVAAEAGARVEQEVVDRIRSERGRSERVRESSGTKEGEHGLHEGSVRAGATAQLQGKREGPRILSARQLRVVEPVRGGERRQGSRVRAGRRGVTQRVGYRLAADELVIVGITDVRAR